MNDVIESCLVIEEEKRKLQKMHEQAVADQSVHDGRLNNLYHAIELGNLDGAECMKIVKMMKTVLAERRDNKERVYILNNIIHHNKKINDELVASTKRRERYRQETLCTLREMGIR